MQAFFKDRKEAGEKLAVALRKYAHDPNAIIIALPRGGVVVGAAIAQALHLPLDITAPRKIGAPFNPELAIGAITETGEGIFSERLIQEFGITQEFLTHAIEQAKKEALSRLERYRKNRLPRALQGKIAIIVDDGIATGSTMFAAIKTLKKEAKKIIVAIPVAPPDTLLKIKKEVDEVICLHAPSSFLAVGQFYAHFDQTNDQEVVDLLYLMSKNN